MMMRMIRKRNEDAALTNEWYIFEGALDKKTCNKIKRLAKDNWEESACRYFKRNY